MPKRKPKKAPVPAPVNGVIPVRERLRCGDRLLPLNPAFENTRVIPTAPQTWNFSQSGASRWA